MSSPDTTSEKIPTDPAAFDKWLRENFVRGLTDLSDKTAKNVVEEGDKVSARLRWSTIDREMKPVKSQLEELKGWTAPEESGLSGTLAGAEAKAKKEDFLGAVKDFDQVKTDTANLHRQYQARPAWTNATGDLNDAKSKLADLKQWKAPEEPDLSKQVSGAEGKAANKDWIGALADFNAARKTVMAVHSYYPERTTWQDSSNSLNSLKTWLGDLKSWGFSEEAGLTKELSGVEGKAKANDYPGALAGLKSLRDKTEALHKQGPARKTWLESAEAIKGVKQKLTDLKKYGAPEESGFTARMTAAENKAAQKKFTEAVSDFTSLKGEVELVHTGYGSSTAWTDSSGDLAAVKQKLTELKNWAAPEEPDLTKDLKAAEEKAGKSEIPAAVAGLRAVKGKAEALHKQYPARKTWLEKAGDLSAIKSKLNDLKSWGSPEVAQLKFKLDATEKQAARLKFTDAVAALDKLKTEITDLHGDYPGRKDWADKNRKYIEVCAKTEELEEFEKATGDTGLSDPHRQELTNINVKVKNKDFAGAASDLDALATNLNRDFALAIDLNRHAHEMDRMKGELEAAKKVPRENPAIISAKGQITAIEFDISSAVRLKVPREVKKLDGLRQTLQQRINAVFNEYETSGNKTTAEYAEITCRKKIAQELTPLEAKVKAVPDLTSAISSLKKEFADKKKEGTDKFDNARYTDALPLINEAIQKGKDTLEARANADRAAVALHKRYERIESKLKGALALTPTASTPLDTAHKELIKANTDYTNEKAKSTVNYQQCMKLLSSQVEVKLEEVLKLHREALVGRVDGATTSGQTVTVIENMQPWELEILPSGKQVEALRKVRKDWAIDSSTNRWTRRPTTEERKAQNKMYSAMSMDKQFLEEDGERRKKLVDKIKHMPEFKNARKTWDKKPPDWNARQKVLQELAKAQCEAFGMQDIPEIVMADLGGSEYGVTNGYFSSQTKGIVINTNRYSSCNDFEKAIDLIAHENSHNYQDQLSEEFIDPNTIDPRIKAQVEMFKINSGPGSYCPPTEEFTTYQKQPLEIHAHFAGPETARGLISHLESEEQDIDLSGIEEMFSEKKK